MAKVSDATLATLRARLGADLGYEPPAHNGADDTFLGFDYSAMNAAQLNRLQAFWEEIEELDLSELEDEDRTHAPPPAAPMAPVSARAEAIPFVLGARWATAARKAGGKRAVAAKPPPIVTRRHMEALQRVYEDLHRLADSEGGSRGHRDI